MIMLGTHKPQQQATITKTKSKSQRLETAESWDLFFARNCSCQDGNLLDMFETPCDSDPPTEHFKIYMLPIETSLKILNVYFGWDNVYFGGK